MPQTTKAIIEEAMEEATAMYLERVRQAEIAKYERAEPTPTPQHEETTKERIERKRSIVFDPFYNTALIGKRSGAKRFSNNDDLFHRRAVRGKDDGLGIMCTALESGGSQDICGSRSSNNA